MVLGNRNLGRRLREVTETLENLDGLVIDLEKTLKRCQATAEKLRDFIDREMNDVNIWREEDSDCQMHGKEVTGTPVIPVVFMRISR